MRSRLVVPDLGPKVGEVRIERWLVADGDLVEFGTELCELGVTSIRVLDQEVAAARGVRKVLHRLNGRTVERTTGAERMAGVLIVITAAEPGVVVSLRVGADEVLAPGTTLAVLRGPTDPADPGDAAASPHVSFRTVADRVRRDEREHPDGGPR